MKYFLLLIPLICLLYSREGRITLRGLNGSGKIPDIHAAERKRDFGIFLFVMSLFTVIYFICTL